MTRRLLVLCALVGACHSPQPGYLPPGIQAALQVRDAILVLAPADVRGAVGDTIRFGAMLIVNGLSVSCAPTTWATSDSTVAAFHRPNLLQVSRPGVTEIRATCQEYVASTTGRFTP